MLDSAEFFCYWTSFKIAGQVDENHLAKMPYTMQKMDRKRQVERKAPDEENVKSTADFDIRMQVVT
jgi:hypothetical protein